MRRPAGKHGDLRWFKIEGASHYVGEGQNTVAHVERMTRGKGQAAVWCAEATLPDATRKAAGCYKNMKDARANAILVARLFERGA